MPVPFPDLLLCLASCACLAVPDDMPRQDESVLPTTADTWVGHHVMFRPDGGGIIVG